MVSLWGFTVLAGLLAAQRLWELSRSRRNEIRMKEKGGFECFPKHYHFMVALHVSWFVAMLAEVWYFRITPPLWLVIAGILGLPDGQIAQNLSSRQT